jgi:aspartyl-tRNA(Asn)/glutamyl-tRNA(Gln) amidotransferase subunit B
MSLMHPKYEVVIGLEVHAQLLTRSKLFCGDSTSFGSDPNSQVSPITLGHPGTLPMMNRKAIEHAIRMGLVCHCDIQHYNYFARKNYFYPDLPKGYQVSQHTTPICSGGFITIVVQGIEKNIRLTRIHLEEDAGKSIHDLEDKYTCLDYNRAGTPLIEIGSEPDLRSADEAFAFLTEIRKLVRWIGVCDGNMEEGSLRCDANISIRLHGDNKLGTRVEVKNLNSVRNVKKAIEVEVNRLIGLVEKGEPIRQETRSFNADNDTTFSIRTKEDADDYRYFPEPDLTPFQFSEAFVEAIRKSLPALPELLREKFISELGLTAYDAHVICEDKDLADYFQKSLSGNISPKALANWLIGPVKSLLNESGSAWTMVQIQPGTWLQLQQLVDDGKLSFSVAAHKLLPLLLDGNRRDPVQIATENNLLQDAGADDIQQWVTEVLAAMPDKVQEYRKGKKGLLGLFMGEVKKRSKGKADPKQTNDLLLEYLHKIQ